MARRPTIKDVAVDAGVSVATVNRVLNDPTLVRSDTARKVADAAHRIGYHASTLIETQLGVSLPRIRLGFVLHKRGQDFYQNFQSTIDATVRNEESFRGSAKVEFAVSQAPGEAAALIRDLCKKVDVIAALAVNHHESTQAVRDVMGSGVPAFALLSDFAQGERVGYYGANHLKWGRGAAHMLAVSARQPGKIALFVGGHRWHGHELRETGFRSYFREEAPEFQVLDTMVNLETRQLTYDTTRDLLDKHTDLVGIFVAGGGMEGAIAALREKREPGQVSLIVNELTGLTRTALLDRYVTMVIATPLEAMCKALVTAMGQAHLAPGEVQTGQNFFEPIIHLPEFV